MNLMDLPIVPVERDDRQIAEVRQNPTSSTEQNLNCAEAFTAGIDHAMRIAREHLARLEHISPPPTEQEPLEFETRHA